MYNYNSIDLKLLEQLIKDNFIHFEKIKDEKSVVLVLGPTKAGKSTLINHMLGHELLFGFKNHNDLRRTYYFNAEPDKSFAVMGDTIESKTSHVTAYTAPNGIVFCDCPGFFDNRSNELGILASISIEYAIKSAKKISGLVLVIDYNCTEIPKDVPQSLSHVCETIGKLFTNVADVSKSLIVALTKLPQDISSFTLDEVSNHMTQKVDDLVKEQARNAVGDPERIRKAILIKQGAELIIESIARKRLILSHKKQADRDALFDMLNSPYLKPIDSKLFDFTTYDHRRNYFNQWIAETIKIAKNFKNEINHILPKEIKNIQDSLEKIETKIKSLEQKLTSKDEEIQIHKDEIRDIDLQLSTYKKNLEKKIEDMNQAIVAKEKDKRIFEGAIDSAGEVKAKSEKLQNEYYSIDVYSQKKQVQNAFWEEASCQIVYENAEAPHYYVVPIGNEGGSFELLGEIKEKGYYCTKYTVQGAWFSGKIHEPHLKVYIDKRYSDVNKNEIKKIEDDIINKKAELSKINNELKKLNELKSDFDKNLKDNNVEVIRLGYRKDKLLDIISQLQEDSREIKKEKEQHQSNLRTQEPICSNKIRTCQNELNAAKNNLLALEQTHRIIYSLSSILEFPAQLSQELAKFRADFNNYQSSSEPASEYPTKCVIC